ncbi:hypothetical protein PHMEG_00027161 [Phytophthora megakarya]|uniref:Reverse transcriptase RNase H-like domain-containing protein n=1 Tax=Phytophthora megakarya TaxID=4795 RepID=A0A225V982_9STRA|nr:hypothetical protein PHMEG_00027161 [Phytophthora megakarya]
MSRSEWETFEILKQKIVSTPLLRHPIREKPFIIILHANSWVVSDVLCQEYDGKIYPVRFRARVLHDQELRYHPAEKEIVGLLRVLSVFYPILVGNATLKVYTGYSVLGWLFKSKSLEDRCEEWAARLAPWLLEVHKIQNDEYGLASILGAGITPRDKLDQIAENLIPTKGRVVRGLNMTNSTTKVGSSVLMVQLELQIAKGVLDQGFHFEDITVNESEYHGMIEGLKMTFDRRVWELIILLLAQFERLRKEFKSICLVHVKRKYNAAVDYVTSKTAYPRNSVEITDTTELAQLKQMNRIPEKLMKQTTLEDTKSGDPSLGPEELASRETQRGPERVSFYLTIPESESIEVAASPLVPLLGYLSL